MSTKAQQVPARLRAGMWFGLLGAPIAWTLQHVTGFALSQATCSEAGRGWTIHMDAWTLVVGATAFTIGLLAEIAAVATWRATRHGSDEPPESRIHFLAVIAATVNPLFMCIIAMSTLGALFLANCQQS
jgi:hypothetical protein